MLYHEGVFGEEVPAGYSGCPSWRVGVRSGRPSTEPATDCPDYEDSGEKIADQSEVKTLCSKNKKDQSSREQDHTVWEHHGVQFTVK